jgi:SAM-dependent methyltransferase
MATERAIADGVAERTCFTVGDAASLAFASGTFDAVAVGSSFGFIASRETALAEAARVLQPSGVLLVACRHYVRTPPASLLDAVEGAIGYLPDIHRDYDWWQSFFRRAFSRSDELQLIIPQSDPERAVQQAAQAGEDPDHPIARLSDETRKACLERLRRTREILSEHDRHQGLSLMVWHK